MLLPSKAYKNIISFFEILISSLIYTGIYFIQFKTFRFTEDYLTLLICTILFLPIILKGFDISKVYRINPASYILKDHIIAFVFSFLGLTFLIFILKLDINRTFLFKFFLINFGTLYIFILSIYFYIKRQRFKGLNSCNIFIVGNHKTDNIISRIETNKIWGYSIKGIITDDYETEQKYINKYPIYSINSIAKELREQPIDEVFYCLPKLDTKLISDLVYICLELGVVFRVTSNVLSIASTKSEIYYVGSTPFFTFQNTPKQSIYLFLKAAFDKIFSFCVLVLGSPFFAIVALCIRLDSKGPVIFKQTRVGLRNREFTLYKFRSMCEDAEQKLSDIKDKNEQDGPAFKMKDDPRITKIGKFIRKTSIDELPQFFNVLKGDMSIIGPRPALLSEVLNYKSWQIRKLSIKPGITCIWQVSGRNNIPFEQWIKLDLQYIDTWSLGLDFMIFIKTIKAVIKHDGQ